MEKVKLVKQWNDHKRGAILTVDAVRAAWLVEHKFAKYVAE